MIIGVYPCCGGTLFLPICDDPPKIEKHDCPHCGAVIWTKHSRVDPESWTDDEFRTKFTVDEAGKNVTLKGLV